MTKKKAKSIGTDRLSNLPDELLLCIMSHLKTRDAVKTCILSKRWRGLWAHIPSLNFDATEFRNQDGGIDYEKFRLFVDSFLILRKISHMDSFRLYWVLLHYNPTIATKCNATIATKWIHRVAECKPRLVQISLLGIVSPLELPHSLFTCASIEIMELTLCCSQVNIRPKSVDLPSLKRLTVRYVTLGSDFMDKLARGCPVLEEMVIYRCTLEMTDIFSPVLKSLVIEHCKVESEVCISIPSLVSLRVEKVELGMIGLRNMSSLVEASLSLYNWKSKIGRYELLSGLSNATHIDLTETWGFTKMRASLAEELPKCLRFKNLKSLYLNECFLSNDCNLIAWLVHLAPNLQKLTLRPRERFLLWEDEKIPKLEMPLQFECRQLLSVKIKYWRDERGVQELAKTLMGNIKTLKKISIERC